MWINLLNYWEGLLTAKEKKHKEKKVPKTMLDFIPFQDVWNNYVYLDNNRIVGGIKVGSINLCLLFDEEQKIKVMELKKVFNALDYPIKIFSIDKPILLDEHKYFEY